MCRASCWVFVNAVIGGGGGGGGVVHCQFCNEYLFTSLGEGSSFLSFKKGDLIILENDTGETVLNSGWCTGMCERTGLVGDFPAECVHVIPASSKPGHETLVR